MSTSQRHLSWKAPCGLWLILAIGVIANAPAVQPDHLRALRIGMHPRLLADTPAQEPLARFTLCRYIKNETGLDTEIQTLTDYHELVSKLENGELEVGVFFGYEFAWAEEENAKLKPLALAVNVYPSRYIHVLARHDSPTRDLGGLEGRSLALTQNNPECKYSQFFLERLIRARGKALQDFFSRLVETTDQETALDDLVDGRVHAAAVDRVALRAYERRKPARFGQIKELLRSMGLPPPVLAFREGTLDPATLKRFQEGLLNARNNREGKRLLTFSRLTGFELAPAEFDRQLAETRKTFPSAQLKH
jgi:ABC-type phosphate/phosphonate transport system substrate-binding protein